VLDGTQSGKTLERQIANSNLGQSGNLGQIATDLARLLRLGQDLVFFEFRTGVVFVEWLLVS